MNRFIYIVALVSLLMLSACDNKSVHTGSSEIAINIDSHVESFVQDEAVVEPEENIIDIGKALFPEQNDSISDFSIIDIPQEHVHSLSGIADSKYTIDGNIEVTYIPVKVQIQIGEDVYEYFDATDTIYTIYNPSRKDCIVLENHVVGENEYTQTLIYQDNVILSQSFQFSFEGFYDDFGGRISWVDDTHALIITYDTKGIFSTETKELIPVYKEALDEQQYHEKFHQLNNQYKQFVFSQTLDGTENFYCYNQENDNWIKLASEDVIHGVTNKIYTWWQSEDMLFYVIKRANSVIDVYKPNLDYNQTDNYSALKIDLKTNTIDSISMLQQEFVGFDNGIALYSEELIDSCTYLIYGIDEKAVLLEGNGRAIGFYYGFAVVVVDDILNFINIDTKTIYRLELEPLIQQPLNTIYITKSQLGSTEQIRINQNSFFVDILS